MAAAQPATAQKPAAQTKKATVKMGSTSKPRLELDRKNLPKAISPDLHMMPEGHKTTRVEYWMKPTHSFSDLLEPEYWAFVAHRFQKPLDNAGTYAGSIIEVRPYDMRFYARLFVRAVLKTGLIVSVLEHTEVGLQELTSEAIEVIWDTTVQGYDIIRKSDREVVGRAKDFKTLDQVQAWADRMGI
jgi:hypothetical protein